MTIKITKKFKRKNPNFDQKLDNILKEIKNSDDGGGKFYYKNGDFFWLPLSDYHDAVNFRFQELDNNKIKVFIYYVDDDNSEDEDYYRIVSFNEEKIHDALLDLSFQHLLGKI